MVDFYGKCGSVREALEIFQAAAKLGTKDVVLWSAMVSACSQGGEDELALELFALMLLEDGVERPCSMSDGYGCEVGEIAGLSASFRWDDRAGFGLLECYDHGGLLECYDHGICKRWRDREFFTAMQAGDVVVSSRTLVAVLQACLDMAEKEGVDGRPLKVASLEKLLTLVSPRAGRCLLYKQLLSVSTHGVEVWGDVLGVFDGFPDKDAVSWNALIAGYRRQGDSDAEFDLFAKPDALTFSSVLSVCCHAGLVEGMEYFHSDYGLSPSVEHVISMVDVLIGWRMRFRWWKAWKMCALGYGWGLFQVEKCGDWKGNQRLTIKVVHLTLSRQTCTQAQTMKAQP
ncbi:pentatricopeptide repeat-containing protein At2g03380, mitochondrial-like [Selaginella moellendorffii]|uniref:pentatricopeptide repeat-containing protein At2g03380, mitochondrial-like n=1 Tax=Selaginella moellendorffii TaxID=88036 RepID=UPI000D1C8739|nr:pentatricopeptide repeat-containing protein At2g03380, mitochondrial-like [Selaginella moellendorffii]|eukprot:XP_024533439.1 pentatricopeptide repeat-containing protein At2g03380, mitochondrial-like [Selaginella moellendorffii]